MEYTSKGIWDIVVFSGIFIIFVFICCTKHAFIIKDPVLPIYDPPPKYIQPPAYEEHSTI